MRGFFSGMIWGLVLMLIGVAGLSVLSPIGPKPEVGAQAPKSAEMKPDSGSESESDIEVARTDADVAEAAPVPTVSEEPKTDDLSSVDPAATTPSEQPEVGDVADAMQDPGETPGTVEIVIPGESDTPVVADAATKVPATPEPDSAAMVETAPAPSPDTSDVAKASEGFSTNSTETEPKPEIVTQSDGSPDNAEAVKLAGETAIDAAPAPSTDSAEPLPVEPEPAPETPVESASEPVAEPEPQQPIIVTPEPAPEPEAPKVAALPQTGETDTELRPTVGKRVVPLTERQPKASTPVASPEKVDNPDLPPLQRYGEAFDNPDNKPLMAIVLIDDEDSIGVEALQDFPYPLTFAIDPAAPNAAERMALHRGAGFEVIALVDLPEAATAQDAEVSLTAGFNTLTEAVGVLEGISTGIQGNRELSGQVAAFVGATGRGLVTQSAGLNTVQKLAVRDGIPSATVFRDFDGAEQAPDVIRRFLDQAAFRAGQDGGVIMMGRIRPNTISALLLWGLQDRASRVALAPVSAVLTQSVATQ